MLSGYLNQTAIYKPKTGTDDRGQPIYGEAVNIACRHQPKIQNILTNTAQTVQTQHVYYLTNHITEGGMLNGKIIMAVSEWVDLSGGIVGYKAVV